MTLVIKTRCFQVYKNVNAFSDDTQGKLRILNPRSASYVAGERVYTAKAINEVQNTVKSAYKIF